jgi:hypothetical protein
MNIKQDPRYAEVNQEVTNTFDKLRAIVDDSEVIKQMVRNHHVKDYRADFMAGAYFIHQVICELCKEHVPIEMILTLFGAEIGHCFREAQEQAGMSKEAMIQYLNKMRDDIMGSSYVNKVN